MLARNLIKSCNKRSRILFVFMSIGYLLVLFKLFEIQVLEHSYWEKRAKAQHFSSITLPSERGEIFSSGGYPLAMNSYEYKFFVDPKAAPDDFNDEVKEVFKFLYSKQGEDFNEEEVKKEWLEALKKNELRYFVLKENVSPDSKQKIESLDLEWLGFIPSPTRAYPNEQAYSHILGFVGRNNEGDPFGYFGVEGFYNGDLRGTDGYMVQESSAGGSPILFGDWETVPADNGSSLKLTLDRVIQNTAYEKLESGVKKYGAESGVVIVVNPETGELKALVNYPTFSPNEYSKYYDENPDIFVNKAISHTYEPGSVIKALTMSSAIDLGLVAPDTTVEDTGPVFYSGHEVDNWDEKHHGTITMTEVLQLSDNIGAAKVGEMVGSKNLYEYFNRFGLNSKLNIDLEGEEKGNIKNYRDWYDIDLAAASFGQGISSTPLQVVMAFSAIANEGVLMKPYVVKEISKEDGLVKNNPEEVRRVISRSSSDTMVEMLTEAVSGGEAQYFVSSKYNVAGKTGTAQISEEGKYLEDKTNATFVGFLPSYRDFVMLVKLEKPSSSVYASETAVPLWMEIAEDIAIYKGLPPDK